VYGFINDVLTEKGNAVFTVAPTVTVREAARGMNEHGIGSLLVVEDGEVIGIFTERDVLKRVVDGGKDPDGTTISEVMTSDLTTIPPITSVADAMSMMTERRIRHLPIVDEGGTLCGLISIGDLMRRVTMVQAQEIDQMADYITGRISIF
jgi:CBS domain-containing protein